MKVLVCGGAGYIGSHLVRELHATHKHDIVILDNLSAGHLASVPEGVQFEKGDIRDKARLQEVFAKHQFNAVFHFSASIEVGESCANPLKYYENNVTGTLVLLQVMQEFAVKYFIFSSTAALFGMPDRVPIEAEDRTHPINPYGETKLVVENMLHWSDQAWGLKSICFRYFNACGADKSGDIGECHQPESHLIPIILQVPLGQRSTIAIFGSDYDTPDGTCVRDYVHVTDL
ncbi:UDP-glucose 4-epimerase, partial [Caulochytrium protostelioides]